MSDTEQPESGSVDWDKVVTIDQFLAAARRHPTWELARASSWGHQTVIIDAGTDEVLATLDELEAATRDFYRRMEPEGRPLPAARARERDERGADLVAESHDGA